MWHFLLILCVLTASLDARRVRFRTRRPRSADDVMLNAADICKTCNDGDESSCDALVELNLANDGVNVCEPGHGDGRHAPQGEYSEDKFEGDIVVPETTGRASLSRAGAHWPNGVVPYVIENVFSGSDKATIMAAMKHIQDNTCIRFKRRTNEKAYIKISNRQSGCFSSLGMVSNYWQPQTLNLDSGCTWSIGTPVHEMLHALGFIHEQNRPDRDQFVHIDWNNIIQGRQSQYKIETWRNVKTYNTRYDYDSVMHYDERGFARDRSRPVMTPYTQGVAMGQRRGLSTLDIYEVKSAYKCF